MEVGAISDRRHGFGGRAEGRGVLVLAFFVSLSSLSCARSVGRGGDILDGSSQGDGTVVDGFLADAGSGDAGTGPPPIPRDAALDGASSDAQPPDSGPTDPCANVSCTGDKVCENGNCVNPDNDQDGYRKHEGDCNDSDENIHPGATEVCDGVDNNCDGQTDEGNVCPTRATARGLGQGDPNTGLQPVVNLLSGDWNRISVQAYITVGADAYEWGLSCTQGPYISCDIQCSQQQPWLSTYNPTPYDCFSDDEEWADPCTLTVVCP